MCVGLCVCHTRVETERLKTYLCINNDVRSGKSILYTLSTTAFRVRRTVLYGVRVLYGRVLLLRFYIIPYLYV